MRELNRTLAGRFVRLRFARVGRGLPCALGGLLAASLCSAQASLEPPRGEVLLIIDGAIEHTNAGDQAHFDLAMLMALERHAFHTTTPWIDGVQHFEGTRLSTLLDTVGARTNRFIARATDDYSIEFDGIDLDRLPVIVAFVHNGQSMSVRQLGPLRIMFPFDDYPATRTRRNEALAVWQLERMTVR